MSLEARGVWEQGFPQETHFIVDDEYRLTIERCSVEVTRYFKLCLVFAYDSEYALWREMHPKEGFIPSFAQGLPGAVEWREFVFVWVRPIKEDLTRVQREMVLFNEYADFLASLRVRLVPALMPKVKWVEVSNG
jgi:hypothetical protein